MDPISEEYRFIPACAGNRLLPLACSVCCAVHPRVCGEQSLEATKKSLSFGSSPRVRGTVYGNQQEVTIKRFIPACAGNRFVGIALHKRMAVHPRVCGEQS